MQSSAPKNSRAAGPGPHGVACMPENSRKFLWLAAAVSLFTLIVVGAAFLIFAPGKSSAQVPFDLKGKAEPRQESPQDYLANPPEAPAITKTTSAGDIIIVYGNDPSAPTTVPPAEAQQKPATTTIVVAPTQLSSPTQSATTTKKAPASAPPTTPVTTVKSAAKTVAPPVIKPATPTTIAKVTPTTKAPAKAAPSQPVAGDYWIQAGSFSVKDNADALKAAFSGKSLPAVIMVKDIDGKSRYIVKVGPYSTRAEASKWLSAAKSVKGAEQAWITQ